MTRDRKKQQGSGAGRSRGSAPRRARRRTLGWGGRRPGAGRKPKGEFAEVAHVRRPTLKRGAPVLITLDLARGLPSLCVEPAASVLTEALAAANGRFGLVLLAHSLHSDHLHLIVRAKDRTVLSRAMNGLCVRTARALNALWGRAGRVFADRYETRVLASPRELRGARRFPCAWRRAREIAGPYRPTTCTFPRGSAPITGKEGVQPSPRRPG